MNFDDSVGLLGDEHNILPHGLSPIQKLDVNVPMLTELRIDTNVQFLDQDDEDDPNQELYISQPFACGTAFAVSVLDCIMSTAYFNDNALTLIRTLITGGTTPELEQILAECSGITPGGNSQENYENRNRPRIRQISLFDKKLSHFGVNNNEFFFFLLFLLNQLCFFCREVDIVMGNCLFIVYHTSICCVGVFIDYVMLNTMMK
jgi:hypothetical protein